MDDELAFLVQDVRKRTASYSFLSRALSSESVISNLVAGLRDLPPKTDTDLDAFAKGLLELSRSSSDDEAVKEGARQVMADHDRLFSADSGTGDWADDGTGAPISLFESDYIDLTATPFWHDQASLRAAVESTYLAEGFTRANERFAPHPDVPLDHICVELGFMAYLGTRVAEGLESLFAEDIASGSAEEYERLGEVEMALNAQFGFVEDHLLPWIPAFCTALETGAQTDFYRGISQMLARLIASEARYVAELGGTAR